MSSLERARVASREVTAAAVRVTPSQRLRRWAAVAGWTLLIYVTLPVAPGVWRAMVRASGGSVRHLGVAGLALAAVVVSVTVLRRHRSPSALFGLLGIAAVYAAALVLIPLTAGERTHFLSYGLLALLAYRALRLDLRIGTSAAAAVAVVAAAGFGDELIQAVLPNRVFEWKDVLLNALSGGLAAAVVWVMAPRERRREAP